MGTDRGTIIVIDDEDWDSYVQLASGMRRRGYTVKLIGSSRRSRRERMRDRVVFNDTAYAITPGTDPTPTLLTAIDAMGPAIDILCNDAMAFALGASDRAAQLPLHARVRPPHHIQDLFDKLTTARLARAAGLDVPEFHPIDDDTIDEAVAVVGFPAVVKVRTSAGGVGVAKVADRDDVVDAVAKLGGGKRDCLMLQSFATGVRHNMSAAVRDGVPLQLVGYYSYASEADPFGPTRTGLTDSPPELLERGRNLLASVGYRGLCGIDSIETVSGDGTVTWWFLEINPRVWGSFESFNAAGLDFLDGYAALLSPAATPAVTTAPDGVELRVVPLSTRSDAIADGNWSLRRFSRENKRLWTTIGWRGFAAGALRHLEYASINRKRR
ncbi:MAG: hypothetical protein AB7V43_06775 [Acidimicrobiia bacterium]